MWKQTRTPNLDPVIYQNGKILYNWLGWCLAYVQTAFNAGWSGPSAWVSWTTHTKGKHTNRDIPKGVYVPIWFDGYWQGNRYGHVAIYKDGKLWTSPISSKPYADVFTSIAAVERAYGMKYVGWSEFVGGTRVIEKVPTVTDAQIKQAYREILERDVDANGLKHYRNQAKNGWTITQIHNDLLKSDERKRLLARKEADRKAAEVAAKKAEEARLAVERAKAEEAARLAEEARKAQEEAEHLAEEERRKKEQQADAQHPDAEASEEPFRLDYSLLNRLMEAAMRLINKLLGR